MADNNSLSLWNDLKLSYTESQGHPVLRNEISKLYRSISPDEVLVVTPEEGIFIAMNTLLEKGDHVITTFPGYQSLYEIANSIGCEVSKWMPKDENGWNFHLNDFKALIREDTKLIVINFPHNPTGVVLQEQDLKEIIKIAEQKNAVVFSDEMYRLLEHNETCRTSSACDLYDNAVSLFGMSKSFALPGLRIGWLTTKNSRLYNKFAAYKDYTTICSSAPGEILSIMALRAKDKILKRNQNLINDNLNLLDVFFTGHERQFDWHRPKAGSIGFPKLKIDTGITHFCLDLVEKKGVMLLPSGVYDFEGNYFRIGFARKNMPETLAKLKEYLSEKYS